MLKTADSNRHENVNDADGGDDDADMVSMDGVHCGEDVGLGSVWEANLRMPAMVRWPGRIAEGSRTDALVSSLDIVPTILSIVGQSANRTLATTTTFDGVDISSVLFGEAEDAEPYDSDNRVLFFWRDGFLLDNAPLGPPYGRFDVVAVKVGRIKAWYWTKSAHYNPDVEQYHDPPLLFDTVADPGETSPIIYDPNDVDNDYARLVQRIHRLAAEHKADLGNSIYPLTLDRDPRYIPCVDPSTGCRTKNDADGLGSSTATA